MHRKGKRISAHKTKAGFTLIELLVVIAIIALLLSIMMPAMRKIRAAGRKVVCLTNVRRIAIAANIYHIDNRALPPFRMSRAKPADTVNYVNEYGREKPRWPWFLNHGIGPVIDPGPYVTNPDDTFTDADTLIMTNKYFMCPEMKSKAKYNPCDIRNGSYGYNYQYLGNTRVIEGQAKFQNFPVKNIASPSQTIVIADSRGALLPEDKLETDRPHGEHAYTLDPPKLATSKNSTAFAHYKRENFQETHSPADARHSNGANTAFLDGHAENLSLKEMGYVIGEDGFVVADQGNNSLFSGEMRNEN